MKDLHPETENAIAAYIRKKEALLSPLAARNSDGLRRDTRMPEDIRTCYSRDADRIIHSRAYSRYIDKTQVFYLVDNDHITHRVLHVQLVSKVARTIGRSLRLNEDLIEAIALGHDIGHIPYGHTGETCLSALCEERGIGPFHHNVQSVRFLDTIEDCNLTLQVLDGILCHDGERHDRVLRPHDRVDWQQFDIRMKMIQEKGDDFAPMTLEGCVVRFADTIAYIGRDIEDAREVGLIDGIPLPADVTGVLGTTNREIIDTLIKDVIEHSDADQEGEIAYSDEVAGALEELRRFNYAHIYHNPALTSERRKIQGMYETLFAAFERDIDQRNRDSKIYRDFVESGWVNERYLESASPGELARDFIAGMTDRYFENRFREISLPRRVDGRFPRHE